MDDTKHQTLCSLSYGYQSGFLFGWEIKKNSSTVPAWRPVLNDLPVFVSSNLGLRNPGTTGTCCSVTWEMGQKVRRELLWSISLQLREPSEKHQWCHHQTDDGNQPLWLVVLNQSQDWSGSCFCFLPLLELLKKIYFLIPLWSWCGPWFWASLGVRRGVVSCSLSSFTVAASHVQSV